MIDIQLFPEQRQIIVAVYRDCNCKIFIYMMQFCEHNTIFSSANNSSSIGINNLFTKLQNLKYSIGRVSFQ